MSSVSRRALLKSGLAASAASLLGSSTSSAQSESSPDPASPATVNPTAAHRERVSMDFDWKFALGNADDPSKDFGWGKSATMRTFAKSGTIEQALGKFDVSSWRTVQVPHDWGVELAFSGADHLIQQGGRPLGREFPETSVGWYHKTFELNPLDKGKRIRLEFEGVYGDTIVLLNGHYIARNLSGYTPILLDITDWANFDEPNVLTLRVDATLGSGWFYEGAGIYRHVWLIKSDPVHLVDWGTWVRPAVSAGTAQIALGSEIRNDSGVPREVAVSWQLFNPKGASVALARSERITVPAWSTRTLEGQTTIHRPELWSLESPLLYRAEATVHAGGSALDTDATSFGIRTASFDAQKGFFLNGKPVRIFGTCMHQDHAGLGVALPDHVQYFRVKTLKSMNSNGIRTSHNPPTPALMDATASLGMLVMCETRFMDSTAVGLEQLERMIRRFRNNPSIILWSLGNEEPEQGTQRGANIIATMKRLAKQLDPTRPCTLAMNGAWGSKVSDELDVQGFNYHYDNMDKFHAEFPNKPCFGSETSAVRFTRGVYVDDKTNGYLNAYDYLRSSSPRRKPTNVEGWWTEYDHRPWLAGSFLWTGFDYGGEPKPFGWPNVISQSGAFDYCGFAKDISYYYKAWWSAEPVLHLFPHWNWPDSQRGQPVDVWCYTNLKSVELFLNGKSQGVRKVERDSHAAWKVSFEPGTIEVRGTADGKPLITKRETVGAPAKIALIPDRSALDANGQDVAVLRVEVQDSQGRLMPTALNEIHFEVTGAGKLIAVGNGCPSSHEPDKGTTRKVFMGLAQAIVQSLTEHGEITVAASSPDLQSTTVTITTNPVHSRMQA